ncbi:hypothetical protein OAS41_01565 [Candidatus Marinimicrobia bacterium]|nr:hypothetical protein [Candidatus Neomarinimicrobiota bacterium]
MRKILLMFLLILFGCNPEDGPYEVYSHNGLIEERGTYKDGKKVGKIVIKEYYDFEKTGNSSLKEYIIKDDRFLAKTGIRTFIKGYYPSGQLRYENYSFEGVIDINGDFIKDSKKLLKRYRDYNQERINRDGYVYSNNQKYQIVSKKFIKIYYDTGQLSAQSFYLNGEEHGRFVGYMKNSLSKCKKQDCSTKSEQYNCRYIQNDTYVTVLLSMNNPSRAEADALLQMYGTKKCDTRKVATTSEEYDKCQKISKNKFDECERLHKSKSNIIWEEKNYKHGKRHGKYKEIELWRHPLEEGEPHSLGKVIVDKLYYNDNEIDFLDWMKISTDERIEITSETLNNSIELDLRKQYRETLKAQ